MAWYWYSESAMSHWLHYYCQWSLPNGKYPVSQECLTVVSFRHLWVLMFHPVSVMTEQCKGKWTECLHTVQLPAIQNWWEYSSTLFTKNHKYTHLQWPNIVICYSVVISGFWMCYELTYPTASIIIWRHFSVLDIRLKKHVILFPPQKFPIFQRNAADNVIWHNENNPIKTMQDLVRSDSTDFVHLSLFDDYKTYIL